MNETHEPVTLHARASLRFHHSSSHEQTVSVRPQRMVLLVRVEIRDDLADLPTAELYFHATSRDAGRTSRESDQMPIFRRA